MISMGNESSEPTKLPDEDRWNDSRDFHEGGDHDIENEEADFVRGLLPDLHEDAAVLDIPCGVGFHAHRFIEGHKFVVTGIDGAPKRIAAAQRLNPNSPFHVGRFEKLGDQNLVCDGSQDAVFCMNTSFGYLPTVAANEKLLKDMYAKLKPSGHLVIQWTFNPNPQKKEGVYVVLPPEAGDPYEHRLSEDYQLPPSDETFRELEVVCYKLAAADKSVPPTKYAYYLAIKHDENPNPSARVPLDAPILRSMAQHAGLPEPAFHAKRATKEDVFHVAMVITKPLEQKDVTSALLQERTRSASGDVLKK
jgi:SAM-dependent methyltransferase